MITGLVLFGLLIASGVFSGSETGVYSLSRVRLRSEAEHGVRSARIIRRLLRNETGLLITLLIANNLVLELLAHETDDLVEGLVSWPVWGTELAVTLLLTPAVFFFGELLPKDLFRRRPHQCLGVVAPLLSIVRVLFWALAWPLQRFSRLVTWVVEPGRPPLARAGREEALEILQEGTRTGALPPEVEGLALNALRLRETRVADVAVEWGDVTLIDATGSEEAQRQEVLEARYSRLPVSGPQGRVLGYVHQLEAFAAPDGAPPVRELPFFAPELALDRALARLRQSGQRIAVVGTPERPRGLVTLTNLVEAIAVGLVGEAHRRRATSGILLGNQTTGSR